jgi:hypothetical protein
MKKHMFLFSTFLAAVSLGRTALAESKGHAPRIGENKDGYSIVFDDDPLDATPQASRGEMIRVNRFGKRTLLLRPRTQFIRELFVSAEDL